MKNHFMHFFPEKSCHLLQDGGSKACAGDSGSPLMVFDTSSTPPTWVHIGIVHGGVVCSNFFKNLNFPEIFSRTEDSEVLAFIRDIMDIMDGDDYYDDQFSGEESQHDCDYYSLSYDEYDDCVQKNQCKTVDGSPCIFPFMLRGKEKTNCISTRRRTRPWCPTQTDSSTGVPVRNQWGYCDDQCSMEGSEIRNFS